VRHYDVAILDLGRYEYGGIPTYGYHLSRALEYNDIDVTLMSHRKKCIQNVKMRMGESLRDLINKNDVLIINGSFIDKKDCDKTYDFLNKITIPRFLIVHDPAEKFEPLVDNVKIEKIITISNRNRKTIYKRTTIPVRYTIHPYRRWSNNSRNLLNENKRFNFIVTSRVDFDKHIDSILKAAELGLIPNLKIHTGYVHRPYIYFKLKNEIPIVAENPFGPDGWRKKYLAGPFGFGINEFRKVYDTATALIDMSCIKGDGARSQYTLLEAFDFGVPIILSRDWDPMEKYFEDGKNCLMVDPEVPKEIGDACLKLISKPKLRRTLIENGYKELRKHRSRVIGRKFRKILFGE
jgi:glycosyltransferase involved in cell wall biosynthesis